MHPLGRANAAVGEIITAASAATPLAKPFTLAEGKLLTGSKALRPLAFLDLLERDKPPPNPFDALEFEGRFDI